MHLFVLHSVTWGENIIFLFLPITQQYEIANFFYIYFFLFFRSYGQFVLVNVTI